LTTQSLSNKQAADLHITVIIPIITLTETKTLYKKMTVLPPVVLTNHTLIIVTICNIIGCFMVLNYNSLVKSLASPPPSTLVETPATRIDNVVDDATKILLQINQLIQLNDQEFVSLLPGELPGYTGWGRSSTSMVGYFEIVNNEQQSKSNLQGTNLHVATVNTDWSMSIQCIGHGDCFNINPTFFVRAYGPAILTGKVVVEQVAVSSEEAIKQHQNY
jgi:hypothetical protein